MSRTPPLPPVATEPDPAAIASSHPVDAMRDEKAMLRELETKPFPSRIGGYLKLSGPGWLQSALTLGGGSLTGSLYLGVLAGFGLLWLQPFAMILGIFSLAAIGYVTLSTGERPFRAINRHINPALGWSWLIASMAANVIWCMPQYSLATAVVQQNLAPNALGAASSLGAFNAKLLIVAVIFVFSTAITWSYGSGHWGVRLYEWMLKIMVAVIVACFGGVVLKMATTGDGLDWSALLAGFIPDPQTLFTPAAAFRPLLDTLDDAARDYWSGLIVAKQRDVLMTGFAAAVGINMTFLLPYSRASWIGDLRSRNRDVHSVLSGDDLRRRGRCSPLSRRSAAGIDCGSDRQRSRFRQAEGRIRQPAEGASARVGCTVRRRAAARCDAREPRCSGTRCLTRSTAGSAGRTRRVRIGRARHGPLDDHAADARVGLRDV
jgi:hypothetical protein